MSKINNKLEKSLEILEKYSNLDGEVMSEQGEYWSYLLRLYESYMDQMRPEFLKAIEKEIIKQAETAQKYFKIVKEEIKSTRIVEKLVEK